MSGWRPTGSLCGAACGSRTAFGRKRSAVTASSTPGPSKPMSSALMKWIAKRVQTPTLVASISAVVSCFLSAAHVKAGKLTVAASEIDQLEAGEVVNLSPRKCGMLGTLLTAWLHAFWGTLTAPKAKRERPRKGKRARVSQKKQKKRKKQEKLDDTARAEIARTVREIMEQERSSQDSADPAEDEDFELKRLVSMFKLLREKGYTLRILPGTPEENAPAFDFETETILRPAA